MSDYSDKPTFLGRLERWGLIRLAIKGWGNEEGEFRAETRWCLWFQSPPKGFQWWGRYD